VRRPQTRGSLFGLRAQYCRVLYWRCKRVRSPQTREALFGLRAQYCSVLCWRCKRVRCPQTRGSPVWSSSPVLQSSVLAVQKSALPSKEKPCLVFELSTAEFCTGGAKECAALKQEEALFGLRAQYCKVLFWRCKRVRCPQKREALFGLRAQYCRVLYWWCKRVRCPQTRGSPVWSSNPVLQSYVLAVQKSALPSKEKPCLVFELSTAKFCTGGAKECAALKQEKPCLVFEPSTAKFCAGGAKECAALKQEEALFGLRAQYCRVLYWRCKRVRCPQTRGSLVWSLCSVLQNYAPPVQECTSP